VKKSFFVFVITVFAAAAISASGGEKPPFDIGVGTRVQSMGGAYIAGIKDSSSIFYNPAMLQTLERYEFQAAYMPVFADTVYNYFAAGVPTVDYGSFGFSVSSISTGNITVADNYGVIAGETSQMLIEMILGWGNSFFYDRFYAGAGIKIDYQSLYDYSDAGFGIDAGVVYEIFRGSDSSLRGGAVIKNIIKPGIKLVSENSIFPRRYIAGFSYSKRFSGDINAMFNFDVEIPVETGLDMALGAETEIFEIFSLRAGYNTIGYFSVGAGVEVFGSAGIDYGFFIQEPDFRHMFSLKMMFGNNVPKMREEKEIIEQKKIEDKARLMAGRELKRLREQIDVMRGEIRRETEKEEYFKAFHYSKGLEAYGEGELPRALEEFETVKKADPSYLNTRYYSSFIQGLLERSREERYSDEILELYRKGVGSYMAGDYEKARDYWNRILEIDRYNKLAIENLKDVNRMLREIEDIDR